MREMLTVLLPPNVAAPMATAARDVARRPLGLSTDALPDVLANLACGRFDRVRHLLHDAGPAPTLPLVAGRYAAWTGDLGTVAAAWAHVHASLERLRDPDHPVLTLLAAAGCTALERTATDLGDAQLAASLLGRARSARTRLEQIALHHEARPIAAACGIPGGQGEGPAFLVLGFVYGQLGAEPDAPRLRLRLRPRLPGNERKLEVRDLSFGDALLRVSLEESDDGLQCRVEQESGAIPITAILELVVSGPGTAAEVDGTPASLSPRQDAGAHVVAVQLVLDAPRTVTLRPA